MGEWWDRLNAWSKLGLSFIGAVLIVLILAAVL